MGEMGGMIGLYFDGACCYFKELPPSVRRDSMGNKQETTAIKDFYNWFIHRDEPILEEPKEENPLNRFNKTFFIHTINKFKNLFK